MALWIKDSKEEIGRRPGAGLYDSIGNIQEIYDDEERVVGTWFGKPLYRKVINGVCDLVGSSVNIPHGITNIDKITNLSGVLDYDGLNSVVTLPRVHPTSQYSIGLEITLTNIIILATYNFGSNKPYRIIVEYTKVGD